MLDLVIRGGLVADTERRMFLPLQIGIKDGIIAALSKEPLHGKREICAEGLLVSPGFIDVHGHVDGDDYAGELSVCQGITTTVGGNCGLSPVDMKAFFAEQEQKGFAVNQVELVGHSFSLRKAVGLEDVYEKASDAQIARMKRLAYQALQDGACGVSFGLDYSPGASLKEIEALAEVSASFGRIVPVHTRLFTLYDLSSLYEMLYIARKTGARLLFSHFVYQYGEGIMREALDIVDRARQDGLWVRIDSGLYTEWATYAGTATFDEQTIRDNELRFGDMLVATGPHMGQWLDEALYRKVREQEPDESIICFTGQKEEIYEALRKDYAMPSTDIGAYRKGEGHPQIAGSFPKFIREMVRERGELTMEEAIYKATLLPARTFSLPNKGRIAVGADADLVIFDPRTIADTAAFPDRGQPDAKPVGIEHVLVNGAFAVECGVFCGTRSGKVLRASGKSRSGGRRAAGAKTGIVKAASFRKPEL